MIAFRNFALRRGERLLLSQVDLALHAGWRVGVIGRNGCGKSSLFAAILGEVEADQGDIDLPGKVRIAWVAQETPSLPDPAIDYVLSGDTEVHAVLQAEAAATAAEDWDAVAEAHQKLAEINGYDATAREVYRPDIYLEAAQSLVDDGLADPADFPWETDGYKPVTSDFIDGVSYDGRQPNAYLESLTIGLKTSQTVAAGEVIE
jgi:energy-coupling factor transporter ATP-binding protein EcfA2